VPPRPLVQARPAYGGRALRRRWLIASKAGVEMLTARSPSNAAGGVRANCLATGVAIWLLSDAAPFTTGATLSVEGGFLA
jgi:hypothetical protein